jgi:hypothetical protein
MGSWSEALGPFILILFVDLTLHAIVHADASHSATAFCLQLSHAQIRSSGICSGHGCKRSRPHISGLRMEKDLEGFDEWYKGVKEVQGKQVQGSLPCCSWSSSRLCTLSPSLANPPISLAASLTKGRRIHHA